MSSGGSICAKDSPDYEELTELYVLFLLAYVTSRIVPTCGGKAKVSEKDGTLTYKKVEDEEAFKKIGQLKAAMGKFKEKAERLEAELKELKAKYNEQ